MLQPKVDGLALLSELSEDAILVSNLLDHPVYGREKIVKVMHTLEDHFTAVSDIQHINTASHRFVDSRALLPSGHRVRLAAVGTRNDGGWISEVVLELDGDKPLPELAKILTDAAR